MTEKTTTGRNLGIVWESLSLASKLTTPYKMADGHESRATEESKHQEATEDPEEQHHQPHEQQSS